MRFLYFLLACILILSFFTSCTEDKNHVTYEMGVMLGMSCVIGFMAALLLIGLIRLFKK